MDDVDELVRGVMASDLQSWDAHRFLEKVTSVAPSVIYVFNQKTQSNEYANRSLPGILGYEAAEIQDMGEAMMPTLCHPDDLPRLATYFASIINMKDNEVAQFEYRMKKKGGRWTWFLSYDTIFERAADGSVLRHLGVATDITEQKEAEHAAIKLQLAAEAANEELNAFTYAISHDMKSPSNTLKMILEELRDSNKDRLDDDATELISMGLNTIGRMQSIVEDVLKYTQVVDHHDPFVEVDLAALIKGILSDLKADIVAKAARFDVDTLTFVEGDKTQLRILFQNLIANAIKFHEPGTNPAVSIRQVDSPDKETLSIEIQDNGIGIAAKDRDRIFGLFKRLHLADSFQGTGLGLAICKRVIINHGGHITVTGGLEQGSTFTVTLPRFAGGKA